MRPSSRTRLLLALALLASAGGAGAAGLAYRFAGAKDPCATTSSAVVVLTASRSLWLCEGQKARARFRVSLGSAGVDKRVEGDRKTPLGTYALSAPRPSARWGTFIPIGYPTPEQRKLGYTGAAVGIHGPARAFRWAGVANAWLDWTAGCIGLASDEEIARVAAVARTAGATVTIR
jgi:murein L,D-transpeptidase YafK